MSPADRKKRMVIISDNQKVKQNRLLISESLSSLFCTIAGAIPKSLIIPKKVIITVATATIPKSSGDNIRDNIAVMINEVIIPLYLDIAVYPTPDSNFSFNDTIYYLLVVMISYNLKYSLEMT